MLLFRTAAASQRREIFHYCRQQEAMPADDYHGERALSCCTTRVLRPGSRRRRRALGDKFPPREINNSAERAAVVFIILCARACRSTVLMAVFRQKPIYWAHKAQRCGIFAHLSHKTAELQRCLHNETRLLMSRLQPPLLLVT